MLCPQKIQIRGKAFVEPDVRPIPRSEVIPKPLVGQFVSYQAVTGMDGPYIFLMHSAVGLVGIGDIFHAAPHEILNDRLIVLLEGISNTGNVTEKLHHLRSFAKGSQGIFAVVVLIHPVIDRDTIPFIFNLFVITDSHR